MRTLVNIRSTEFWSISCSGFKTCIKSKQNCQLMNCFVQTLFIRNYELLCSYSSLDLQYHYSCTWVYHPLHFNNFSVLNLLNSSKDFFLPTLTNLKLASRYILQALQYTDRNVLDKSYQLVKHFLDFPLWEYRIA